MAKLCECCGKKNNFFVVDEFYITDEKILCEKCAEHIRRDFNAINYVKSKEQYEELKNKILNKCKECFDDTITNHILVLIEEKYNRLDFVKATFTDDKEETTGMFGNIGVKIKSLAQITTWLGIIGSVILGFVLLATDEDLILAGLLVALLGSLISWVSSFVLYGFGQLIENTDKLVELSKK